MPMRSFAMEAGAMMAWNKEPIPVSVALQIGWNLPMDVVGAGVYGGIAKRNKASGHIIVGDEWPEDNWRLPAHNPVHSTGPYLDFSKFSKENRGYTHIARLIMAGNIEKLETLFQSLESDGQRQQLANLVMTGGARPLHMCGMSRGGDSSALIQTLLNFGADVNARDNYEMTPMDRLASNSVHGNQILRKHGAKMSSELASSVPKWAADEYLYLGPGEA